MKTAIVIPARYGSTRLPGKPLLRQTGKYLIQHVYEQACLARRASAVVVATDDSRIAAAVESFGGRVAMTRRDHPSGTDRVADMITFDPFSDVLVTVLAITVGFLLAGWMDERRERRGTTRGVASPDVGR